MSTAARSRPAMARTIVASSILVVDGNIVVVYVVHAPDAAGICGMANAEDSSGLLAPATAVAACSDTGAAPVAVIVWRYVSGVSVCSRNDAGSEVTAPGTTTMYWPGTKSKKRYAPRSSVMTRASNEYCRRPAAYCC